MAWLVSAVPEDLRGAVSLGTAGSFVDALRTHRDDEFRSFGPGKSVIEFPADENLVAVVGSNNAGKSNLLQAVRLALGSTRRDAGDPSDFHQLDITQELRIDLVLREPSSGKTSTASRTSSRASSSVRIEASAGPTGVRSRPRTTASTTAATPTGRPAALGKRSGRLDPDVDPVRFLPTPANRIAPLLGRVHYLSPSLYRAFETSGYGVLAQLLDLYRDDFRSDANTYEVPVSKEIITRAAAFDRVTTRMREILRTTKLAEIEASLSENLRFVLGPTAAGAEVTIALPTAEELLADVLSLRVQDDAASPVLSVDRLGDGYRSLLRLAILRTYTDLAAEERPSVFLVEEPEAYLNPHLRRYFAGTLRKLAELGNDVLLTTHDAAFVSLPEYRTVMRIAKQGGTSRAHRCTASIDFAYERLAQKLRRGGNSEVFFAAKAILCEGQDDVAAVRAMLDRRDIDPDSLSISVLDCGGRENLPDYVRLLDELGIEPLVITDGDASKIKDNDTTARNIAAVEAAATGRMFRFEEDIETALGTDKRGRENAAHLVSVIEGLDLEAMSEEGEIARCIAALTAFCRGATAPSSPVPNRRVRRVSASSRALRPQTVGSSPRKSSATPRSKAAGSSQVEKSGTKYSRTSTARSWPLSASNSSHALSRSKGTSEIGKRTRAPSSSSRRRAKQELGLDPSARHAVL